MYEFEDITEEYNDGYLWLSVIEGMTCYRVKLMESLRGYKKLHVYDQEDNEVEEDKAFEIGKKAEEWANGN